MSSTNDPLATALGGLLGALVNGAVQARSQTQQTEQPPELVLGSISESETPRGQSAPTMEEVLGSLLGGTAGTQPRGGEDALGSLLGSLLGGGTSAAQPRAGDEALGSLLGSLLGGGAPSTRSGAGDEVLGSLLGSLLGGGTTMPSQRGYPPSQVPATGDPIGTLLSGLLGVDVGGGAATIANNPIANAFVQPIAEALARKTGMAPGIARVVVVFAINALLSGLTQQGARQKFSREELIEKLQSGEPITQKYLKESGLLPALVEETGLNQKVAAQSLQQVFRALGTQMIEGTPEERQQELQTFLRKWK
ncbi:MAG: DUF937 domain-containing protein [Anaerolineae bacterium]|nr:DUF937 domain-containing protein [Anaerolineae bacterium]